MTTVIVSRPLNSRIHHFFNLRTISKKKLKSLHSRTESRRRTARPWGLERSKTKKSTRLRIGLERKKIRSGLLANVIDYYKRLSRVRPVNKSSEQQKTLQIRHLVEPTLRDTTQSTCKAFS